MKKEFIIIVSLSIVLSSTYIAVGYSPSETSITNSPIILLVDDDDGTVSPIDGTPYEQDWMNNLDLYGWTYNYWEIVINGTPTLGLLQSYDAIIWFCTEGYPQISSADRAVLGPYLDGGGRLFLSGADIAWDMCDPLGTDQDVAWFQNYLKATYLSDGVSGAVGIKGIAGDPISDSNSSTPAPLNVSWVNTIGPNGGVKCWDFCDGIGIPIDGAAVRYDETIGTDNYRLVYESFNHEDIGIWNPPGVDPDRAEILDKSLKYLLETPPQDLYPIYGYVYQFGEPTPVQGCNVTVEWWNVTSSSWDIKVTVSNISGMYSVDLQNYSDGGMVYCNVTFNPIYGDLGNNYTTIDIVGSPGGQQVDIICGWELIIVPEIISTIPTDGEVNVPLNQDIVITFSLEMNTSSVAWSCTPDPGGWIEFWSGNNTILTLGHNDFSMLTTYTFEVISGEDVEGNPLSNGSVPNPWSFTTIGSVYPDLSIDGGDITFSNSNPSQWEEITISAEVHSNDWVEEPPVQVIKTVDKSYAPQGDFLVYTIYCNNTGPDWADSVNITDELHWGVIFVDSVPPPNVINGNTLIWYLTNLAPGSNFIIDMVVQIDLGVSNGTVIENHVICDYSPNGTQSEDWAYTTVGGFPFGIPNPSPGPGAYCTVSFYLDSIISENLIYREYEVFIPNNGSTVVSHDWLANVLGNYAVIVDITDSNPPEAVLSNNTAFKDIYISEPCGKLKVQASSDKQKYMKGVDNEAQIIVKVTYQGYLIENATVLAWVIDPNEVNNTVTMSEISSGIYLGIYPFTNDSVIGTYRIKAIASKAGYINGTNNDAKDKFFLDSPAGSSPKVLSVSLSNNLPIQGSDVVITATMYNYATFGNIYANVINHGYVGTFTLPLYDDGTHSDITPGDGLYTNSITTNNMKGTYTVDIVVDEIVYEKRAVMVVSPQDTIALETITGQQTIGNSLHLVSSLTNTTLNLTTSVGFSNMSFIFVERRTTTEGKRIDIIPSRNVNIAMVNARIELSYTTQDIPVGINESDMRLYLFNSFTGIFEPCIPGGIDTMDDIVWGDTEHFSSFRIVYATDIWLDAGWNLISLPLAQTDTSIQAVFSSIDGKWDYIQYYDARDSSDPWKSYATFKPPSLNDLHAIDHTMAIWINVTEACTLTVTGIVPAFARTNIPLYAGWNLVGYSTMNNAETIAIALWGTGADRVEVCDVNEPYSLIEVGASYIMQPGEGYWVHVVADSVWVVDW